MRTLKESQALRDKATKIVNNEVFMNLSSIFEDALKGNDEIHEDYIEELCEYCHNYRCNAALEQVKEQLSTELTKSQYEALEELGYLDSYDELYQVDHSQDQGEIQLSFTPTELAEESYGYNEPDFYESWGVSSWLASKLRDQGEFVFDYGWIHVWQRQTTGQAIAIDYVMLAIAQEQL